MGPPHPPPCKALQLDIIPPAPGAMAFRERSSPPKEALSPDPKLAWESKMPKSEESDILGSLASPLPCVAGAHFPKTCHEPPASRPHRQTFSATAKVDDPHSVFSVRTPEQCSPAGTRLPGPMVPQ